MSNNSFSPKELRVIKLLEELDNPSLERSLSNYHLFIDTLVYLNEALREAKIQVKLWEKYSETLILKFVFHGLTLHSIIGGLTLNSQYYEKEIAGKKVLDKSSANVIHRSQLECFLMYQHIYVNADEEEEQKLRAIAWIYSALKQRQEFPVITEFGKVQKERDEKALEEMKSEILALPNFQKLSPKQQHILIEKGSGKLFKHWAKIIEESGFSSNHVFSVLYNYWSMYSHSEGVSALQMSQYGFSYNNSDTDAISGLEASQFMVCLMIKCLVEKYDVVKARYEMLSEDLRIDIEFNQQRVKMALMGS